jgi:N-acyl-D-amino-acid deacylase
MLHDRGLIKPGMAADIVIFDENLIGDEATFSKPHAYSKGFSHVLVNGVLTISNGQQTGARNGVALRGPAAE